RTRLLSGLNATAQTGARWGSTTKEVCASQVRASVELAVRICLPSRLCHGPNTVSMLKGLADRLTRCCLPQACDAILTPRENVCAVRRVGHGFDLPFVVEWAPFRFTRGRIPQPHELSGTGGNAAAIGVTVKSSTFPIREEFTKILPHG